VDVAIYNKALKFPKFYTAISKAIQNKTELIPPDQQLAMLLKAYPEIEVTDPMNDNKYGPQCGITYLGKDSYMQFRSRVSIYVSMFHEWTVRGTGTSHIRFYIAYLDKRGTLIPKPLLASLVPGAKITIEPLVVSASLFDQTIPWDDYPVEALINTINYADQRLL
jgi:hypothetical protein